MNKTELKNFAIQSRRQLINQVKIKALMYGIDDKNDLEIQEQFGQLMINDKPYPLYMKQAFNSLKNQLRQKGYKQLVEEVAYTWFNRIIAIRYMEVHDYLPEKVNVLSSSVGRVDPDILFEYETMDLPIKQEEIRELLDAGDTEGAYRKLFIAQCNKLNSILPFLFEQIQDYTELLLPDFLLDAESVIKVLVQNDELTNSFDEIEVIGWLYQYYIAEEKDRVFAQKSKYKKEEIPFATQLFTPKWIVQYMVQNSLGRYWTEAHREDEDLISNWEYFIKHQEEDFHEKIAPYVNKELRVEDIKLLDPAMGSGHILVYAFEVFHQIYEKCAYPERDIPRLIIENNLYGLDIDDRAYQLAAFAVVMKAASYSRRFLRSIEREGIRLNLASIQETNHVSDDVIAYIAQEEKGERYKQVKAFFDQYENAKTYGSLINITERNLKFVEERLEHIQNHPVEDLFFAEQHDTAKETLPSLIQQTKIMRNKYDVVVTNPPYMGNRNMNTILITFINNNYPDSKGDLFSAFMEVEHFMHQSSIYACINQNSWMFLSSYEKLRKKIIDSKLIDNMIHLGPRAFEEISGEVVQSTTFILRNYTLKAINGRYLRLVEEKNPILKQQKAIDYIQSNREIYSINQTKFNSIPSYIIGYWVTENIEKVFSKGNKLGDIAAPRQGVKTLDNDRFLKFWFEVPYHKIGFNITSLNEALDKKYKWFPYNKGGTYMKWYGNNEYVVNWENDGQEMKEFAIKKYNSITRTITNISYFFKKGITWSALTSGGISLRLFDEGFIFDSKGSSMFFEDDNTRLYVLAFLNSNVAKRLLEILSPTLDFNVGPISNLPIIPLDNPDLLSLTQQNVKIAEENWNDSEVSWDFTNHPLLKYKENATKLNEAYINWSLHAENRFNQQLSNEEQINKILISCYQLEKEVNYKVDTTEIALKTANKENDAKSFLSYFIGVITGRYTINNISVKPYIQITETKYFENDIITRLREFLSIAFSPITVDENMQWLAEALEMKNSEDTETRLRRYFLDEFFADHCRMYQKRPIYWLVDSGKQKGLRTLIYMHHYQPDTMATIRFQHLQEIQAKYQNEIIDLENRLVNPNLSASEKKKLTAEKTSFEKKIDELREFDKRLAEIANEELEIDLDDGVKVNYEKFYRGGKGVLAKIK
ncbi:BREX-1 system adenine-specific DNA-methyltransferase PglX [Lysinibacillus sp. FSL K6-4013]|uniref:BREX-1 system adenine-specific DNA-methyltransferase PglX n=1 Tax=Lysinibacillus sp. FSL K6-4013 TaxID=2921504 RepID=UPI00315A54D3